jgi:hypothetical protein
MPFSVAELQNISAAALDFYVKGAPLSQVIQERPLSDDLIAKQKTFPGGKDFISIPVKGAYNKYLQGFSHDDPVGYTNPTNIRRVQYPWREAHGGIGLTLTELKKDGISVVDSESSEKTTEHSDRELTVLTGILDDKLEDMAEGWARDFQSTCWLDGTQDAKLWPGVTAFITDDPTTGIVGGIDRASNPWFRHRALVGANKLTASAANSTLTLALRKEFRQLRRFRGKPTKAYCGSDFLAGLELEIHAKGFFTQTGFAKQGRIDIGMAEPELQGVEFVYEPSLDDIGFSKRSYVLDLKHLGLRVMDGEDRKTHSPARPYDRYVMYRAMTWTGGMVMDQANCHGVYEIA